MSEIKMISARAPVADSTALMRLLDGIPDAEDLRTQLGQPCFARRWQPSGQYSYWIASDGTTALCLTLSGLDLDEVIALWLSFDEHRRRPGFALSARVLGNIIEQELGLTVELEN
jgi:hypothetical protein